MTPTPLPSSVTPVVFACALCDHAFVVDECVMIYEEDDVAVLAFCRACAVRVALPPGGALTEATALCPSC